jgi:hypothetical protein
MFLHTLGLLEAKIVTRKFLQKRLWPPGKLQLPSGHHHSQKRSSIRCPAVHLPSPGPSFVQVDRGSREALAILNHVREDCVLAWPIPMAVLLGNWSRHEHIAELVTRSKWAVMLSFAVLSTLLRLHETESWSRQFGQATVPFLVSCRQCLKIRWN